MTRGTKLRAIFGPSGQFLFAHFGPVSQENSTLGNFDAASIFPRKFDRLNPLKRQIFLRIYGRL